MDRRIMLLALLFFWVPFKAGMVRHDGGHAPMAGLFLLTSSLLVLFCLWQDLHWRKRLLSPLLLLPLLVCKPHMDRAVDARQSQLTSILSSLTLN